MAVCLTTSHLWGHGVTANRPLQTPSKGMSELPVCVPFRRATHWGLSKIMGDGLQTGRSARSLIPRPAPDRRPPIGRRRRSAIRCHEDYWPQDRVNVFAIRRRAELGGPAGRGPQGASVPGFPQTGTKIRYRERRGDERKTFGIFGAGGGI